MPLSLRRLLTRSRRKALKEQAEIRVLMVCAANFCRSPMAEGVLGHLLEQAGMSERVFVDSAGTHAQGDATPPDMRGQRVAAKRGINLSAIRSRLLTKRDLDEFDYLLAMDRPVYQHMLAMSETPQQRQRVHLFLSFAADLENDEVPDPYYGGSAGFERVMGMLQHGAYGFLQQLREKLL